MPVLGSAKVASEQTPWMPLLAKRRHPEKARDYIFVERALPLGRQRIVEARQFVVQDDQNVGAADRSPSYMTGWHISVYRQLNGGENPSAIGDEVGERLAAWQANFRGLEWIDCLVRNGTAVKLAEGGYPREYSARAKDVLPFLEGEPAGANHTWIFGMGDIIGDGWLGKTTKSAEVIAACSPDEWLMIRAWDES